MDTSNFDDNRPSPDAILNEINIENRGKLKIFLGAAPGVGKTYAMLKEAHALLSEGIDVIIGIIVTHDRPETAELVENIPFIPLTKIEYRGKIFEELDVEAILQRKPHIVLIDELAHTNIEGTRHTKRYQDIEEILNAGINVHTTLNIQHLESLNDLVSKITKVFVQETVPDKIMNLANEIELIDLPSKELQKRLVEGKIYKPDKTEAALNNFFTEGNLTALREMALRYTAERVDHQMINYMQAHGIAGPWATGERIIVCIGNDKSASELIRNAARSAERTKVPWTAIYVDQSNEEENSDLTGVNNAITLAEELGGSGEIITGDNIEETIISYARNKNVTRILIGKSKEKWWHIAKSPLSDNLINLTNDFEITVIPLEEQDEYNNSRQEEEKPNHVEFWKNLATTTFATLISYIFVCILSTSLSLHNLSLIFLTSSIYVAINMGSMYAIYSLALGFIIYNFIALNITEGYSKIHTEYIITFSFFTIIILITSNLARQLTNKVSLLKQNIESLSNLYKFSTTVLLSNTLNSVIKAIIELLKSTIGEEALVMISNDEENLELYDQHFILNDVDNAAATWCFKNEEIAGSSSNTLTASKWTFFPMRTDSAKIGVIGVFFEDQNFELSNYHKKALASIASQAAIAIERAKNFHKP